jgi:FKBP-type peptidyl-prolyl cis-trans isomerase 2
MPSSSQDQDQPLPIGEWVPIEDRKGRHRSVRIIEVRAESVVVDTNHRRAGQSLELEIELVGFLCPKNGLRYRSSHSARGT